MSAESRGSLYRVRDGWGIRWPENGHRLHQSPFATKTDARRWFADNVAPRLRRHAPSADVTLDEFADIYLARHGATVSQRTRETIAERLAPARAVFGDWTLAELEGAAADSPHGARRCPSAPATG